jgi:hypothetical protein
MSLRSIVRALGGDLYAGGLRANVPAPGHSRADRSVSLLLSGGRVIAHGFGGADWREVLDDLRRRGLVNAAGAPASGSGAGVAGPAPEPLRMERLAVAQALWAAGLAIAPHTECHRHLLRRRIGRSLPGCEVLRRHPAAPLSVYEACRAVRPALMAGVVSPDGELTAVELTYLDPSGRRAQGVRFPRKTVGLVPPSSAVRLDAPGSELLVGEGVFTTLSASERFDLPAWALLSTRNLRSWRAPDGVRRVLIAADRGEDGARSAGLLAARLRRNGVGATVRPPPAPYGDWNDWARAQRDGPGGEGRAERDAPGRKERPSGGAGEPP